MGEQHVGEPQRDIPAATTRWAPSSLGRLGFSARDRQLYFFPETSERAEERARGGGRASDTHLDLGRLEGRDGAGESGGNAGHC